MRRDIARWGILSILAAAIVGVAALGAGCRATSGGSSSAGQGATASSNLDTAKAVEVQVTKANGGMAHVDTGKGGVDVYIPPGAVSKDMQLVVTPLLKPEPATGSPLNAGISVVQKGQENQHVVLSEPAFVSFTVPGRISPNAVVVSYDSDSSGQAYGTSVVTTGGVSTITAAVPGFTVWRVEMERERDLARVRKKLPKFVWNLQISGTVPNENGPLRWFTTANGTMASVDMMTGLNGDVDFNIEVWVKMGGAWAKGGTSTIHTTGRIDETSFRIVNPTTGSFVLGGYGTTRVTGSVSEHGTVEAEGASGNFAKNAAGNGEFPMVVTASNYAVEGRPVPAKVAIWIGGRRYDFKGKLTEVGVVSWTDSQ